MADFALKVGYVNIWQRSTVFWKEGLSASSFVFAPAQEKDGLMNGERVLATGNRRREGLRTADGMAAKKLNQKNGAETPVGQNK